MVALQVKLKWIASATLHQLNHFKQVIQCGRPKQWLINVYLGLSTILLTVQCWKKYLDHGVIEQQRPSFLAAYYNCVSNSYAQPGWSDAALHRMWKLLVPVRILYRKGLGCSPKWAAAH
jgi:hypothetical protein